MNPWLKINYQDYEAHMSHDKVFQLQTLDKITGDAVALFKPEKSLVLGAAAGNGFRHFKSSAVVHAIDINKDFLTICQNRYHNLLPGLKTIQLDINSEALPEENNFFDLVICHLLLEYADNEKIINEIYRVLKTGGTANIVIQKNNNNKFVSDTGINGLNILSEIAAEVSELELENLCGKSGLILTERNEMPLPNGKSFLVYNYRK